LRPATTDGFFSCQFDHRKKSPDYKFFDFYGALEYPEK